MADTKTKISPLAAGIAGGIAGAVTTAAAIALSDQKNRQKVKKSLIDAKKWGDKTVDTLGKNISNTKDLSEKTLSEMENKADTLLQKSDNKSLHAHNADTKGSASPAHESTHTAK